MLLGIRLHHLEDEFIQLRGDSWPFFVYSWGRSGQAVAQGGQDRTALRKGLDPGQCQVQRGAEAEHVGSSAVYLAGVLDLLRCHVSDRPKKDTRFGQFAVAMMGQAKIQYLPRQSGVMRMLEGLTSR